MASKDYIPSNDIYYSPTERIVYIDCERYVVDQRFIQIRLDGVYQSNDEEGGFVLCRRVTIH